jgi:ABC-type multidrug transport system ATPase subunit
MGSSGCGKTSLLNMISDRISITRGQSRTGTITLNDREALNNQVFGKIGAYVMQDDILFNYFNPREALKFAARLKL